MANSYVQNIMHVAFHVGRDCTVDSDDIVKLCSYIGGIVRNLGGVLIAAGGMPDHIHLLLTVPKTLSLSDYISKIKANSSRWLKSQGNLYRAFAWQDGYGAFSVSGSKVDAVRQYIAAQAEHHRMWTFAEEVAEFWETYQNKVSPLRGSE